jgi:hypothetical protein
MKLPETAEEVVDAVNHYGLKIYLRPSDVAKVFVASVAAGVVAVEVNRGLKKMAKAVRRDIKYIRPDKEVKPNQ